MLNKYNKNKILDEIGNAYLDDDTIVSLFNQIYDNKKSVIAQYVLDCLSCELNILQMKRLAVVRNLSNNEVLLAYNISCLWNSLHAKESNNWSLSSIVKKKSQHINNLINKDVFSNNTCNINKMHAKQEHCKDENYPEKIYDAALSGRKALEPTSEQLSILCQSPEYAALYCINVLNRKNDILELAIMKDPYWWQVYQNWTNAPK